MKIILFWNSYSNLEIQVLAQVQLPLSEVKEVNKKINVHAQATLEAQEV